MEVPDWPRIGEILSRYRLMTDALAARRTVALRGDPPVELLFATAEEMAVAYNDAENEVEQATILMLVASCEAVFRADCAERVRNRLHDGISLRRLHRLAQRKNLNRTPLAQVLAAWRIEVGPAGPFNRFAKLMMYRHWLVHGRWWSQKSGLRGTDATVFGATVLIKAVLKPIVARDDLCPYHFAEELKRL